MEPSNSQNVSHYLIGVVARLTGISTDKLRIWERRYAVVDPVRTDSGKRLYSETEIRRLRMIKQLVDRGDYISRVAKLSDGELKERLQAPVGDTVLRSYTDDLADLRVIAFGADFERQWTRDSANDSLNLLSIHTDWDRFNEECIKASPDLVLIEFTTLQPTTVQQLANFSSQFPQIGVLVFYGVASSLLLRDVHSLGIRSYKKPVDFIQLPSLCIDVARERLVKSGFGDARDFDVAPRRFGDEELADVALKSTHIGCECPAHLVELINALSGFETYSTECAARNDADRYVHRFLGAQSSKARALIEDALAKLYEAE